ncbi:hypothetical protein GCM10009665_48920 [Kitasatospora nipponensis]|uniref:non-specific serine/threonine protein kinase n=1 Tax=Kitasatospora nipponensis TaxID=258049 RepID=A0ABN1WJD3_9ACTN
MSDDAGKPPNSRYQLVRALGHSAAGVVWEGLDRELGHQVAVRVVGPECAAGPESVARFLTEAAAVGRLAHPHLVTVQDTAERTLVMELLRGRTLDTVIAAGPLDLGHVLVWAQQVTLALQAAHTAGVVHWGLKPARLLIGEQGGLKVLDFGVAHLAPAATTGGAPYLAPEQWQGSPSDGRTDLYALGCVLFELCTGRRPFEGLQAQELMHRHLHDVPQRPALLRPGIPAALDELIVALLAKDRTGRPADAAEVRGRLATIAAGFQGEAEPEGVARIRGQVDQAWALGEAGRAGEAVQWLGFLVTEAARTLGPTSPQTLQVCYDLAIWRSMAEDVTGAVGLLTDLLPLMLAVLGPGHEDVARATKDLWSYQRDLQRRRYQVGSGVRPGEVAMLLGLPPYPWPPQVR